jgi:hypothetical protein
LIKSSKQFESLLMLQRIRGGVNETELKLFTVIPIGFWSESSAVTIVTPVAKLPNAFRSSFELSGLGLVFGID